MTTRSFAALALPVGAMLAALLVLLPGCVLIPRDDHHGYKAMEAGDTLIGAWLGEWPGDSNPVLRDFERTTEVRLDLVDVYLDWSTPVDNVTHAIEHIAAQGALPILTWEAHGVTTADVLAGSKKLGLRDGTHPTINQYLAEFAEGTCGAAKSTQQPILVRVFHEMNGDWFSWGSTWTDPSGDRPNDDRTYRAAFAKVHDAFDSRCGDDVRFVWAINHFSVGRGATFTGTYPGDRYVDFVGIDGYNWGSRASWGWQEADDIFTAAYCAVTAVTTKPVLVAEVASTEQGGDKATWIAGFYQFMEDHPRVQGFVWLHDAKHEVQVDGSMDWRVDSSETSRKAFTAGAQEILDDRPGQPPARALSGCDA